MVGDSKEEIVCSTKILINLFITLEVFEIGFDFNGNGDNTIVFPSLVRKKHQDSIVPKTSSWVRLGRDNIFSDLIHGL